MRMSEFFMGEEEEEGEKQSCMKWTIGTRKEGAELARPQRGC